MKRIFPISLGISFLGLLIWTGVFLYQKSVEDPVVYQTATPFVSDIIKKTVATGSVKPRREVAVKSQVSGIVETIYVKAGDHVKEGQLLAKVKIIPSMASLNNAETNLNRARISYEDALKELTRQEKLYQEKLIAEAEYNQFLVNFKRCTEDLEAAENNLMIVREGASKKSGNASNNLVKATASGMVLDVPVKEGGFVIESNTFNEGTSIAIIADMTEMIFEGKVDESEIEKIKVGMNLNLTIGALSDKTYNATLEFISPKGVDDQGTIQFGVRAAVLLKENEFIRAGYSANADIVLDKRDSVLAIGEHLLQFDNNEIFVEVETAPQKFEKRPVKAGLSDGIIIEILSGLNKEEKIKIVQKNTGPGKPEAAFGKRPGKAR